ncbi:hypothetical protein BO998_25890, partial [Citrobacter werkmanii]
SPPFTAKDAAASVEPRQTKTRIMCNDIILLFRGKRRMYISVTGAGECGRGRRRRATYSPAHVAAALHHVNGQGGPLVRDAHLKQLVQVG